MYQYDAETSNFEIKISKKNVVTTYNLSGMFLQQGKKM